MRPCLTCAVPGRPDRRHGGLAALDERGFSGFGADGHAVVLSRQLL
jgi:hypothetical protein